MTMTKAIPKTRPNGSAPFTNGSASPRNTQKYGEPAGAFQHPKRWRLQPDTINGALARTALDYQGAFDDAIWRDDSD
jgi:hypothetical protein